MTRLFYEQYVPADRCSARCLPTWRPITPERVAAWLAETFGGPTTYSEQYGGYDWMVAQHMGKALTEAQRARWVQLMSQCADEADAPIRVRAAFVSYLEWGLADVVELDPGRHAATAHARSALVVGRRARLPAHASPPSLRNPRRFRVTTPADGEQLSFEHTSSRCSASAIALR